MPDRTFHISVNGDNDCSDGYCGFQAALDSASIDSAHITFLLSDGVYKGHYEFMPDSGNSYGDIIIEGGWDSNFENRSITHETVLDGEEIAHPLKINKNHGKSPGSITIDGLKVINGRNNASGGGIIAFTYGDDITIQNCVIMNNQAYNPDNNGTGGRSGGGIYTYPLNVETNEGGDILYKNNYIAENRAESREKGAGSREKGE